MKIYVTQGIGNSKTVKGAYLSGDFENWIAV